MFLCPSEYTGEFLNGLSSGIVPSKLTRNILPASEERFCARCGFEASPVGIYNLLSGPIFILPPLLYKDPGIESIIIFESIILLSFSFKRESLC